MSAAKLYVGNLNYRTTEDKLKELFSQYGEVNSVNILQGRGFGFVEIDDPEQARAAIASLNGKQLGGRALTVNEAKPQGERGGGRGRGGGGGGRDFGGRGDDRGGRRGGY